MDRWHSWIVTGPRHHRWFDSVQLEIQEQYDKLHAEASKKSNIQKSGHGGEATWAAVLADWLPPGYEVGVRKYVLPELGLEDDAFETDLVVFNRGYPRRLHGRHEVLSGGVAAAFSVKLTLDAAGIRDGVDRASRLRRALKKHQGTVRSELIPPMAAGLLAHSHVWRSPGSNPFNTIDTALERESDRLVKMPREVLDLTCVSDVATWTLMRTVFRGQQGREVDIATMGSLKDHSPAPVGVFIAALVGRLAHLDPSLEPFAAGLTRTNTLGSGVGRVRSWSADEVFSPGVASILRGNAIPAGDEWRATYRL